MNKLQEFTDLQMEGSDVLMGTFSMLKHFDFFRDEENWFLPFAEGTSANGYVLTYKRKQSAKQQYFSFAIYV